MELCLIANTRHHGVLHNRAQGANGRIQRHEGSGSWHFVLVMNLCLKHAELCWIGLSVVRVWVWNLVCHTEGRIQTEGEAVGGGKRTPSIWTRVIKLRR